VIVVDVNLLLYVVNHDLPQHPVARAWWEDVLSRHTPVGLAWGVVLAFLRISTHPRIFERPLKIESAAAYRMVRRPGCSADQPDASSLGNFATFGRSKRHGRQSDFRRSPGGDNHRTRRNAVFG
jgi:predicted nucleic acid-binding protein